MYRDHTIEDSDKGILYFGTERFLSEIAEADNCFLCGTSPSESDFNDEHVLPAWIVRKLDLSSSRIVLPNQAAVPYSRYKIRCCRRCNSLLSRRLETPISHLWAKGYKAAANQIRVDGPWLIFKWLSLVFFKTHLKDRDYRISPDTRHKSKQIADTYDWNALHHIHCLIHAILSQVEIHDHVLGSLVMLPAKSLPAHGRFDFGDLYAAQTIMLRLDDICVIAVLNDSGACLQLFSKYLDRITGPLSPVQIREVYSNLAYINLGLKTRSTFATRLRGFSQVSLVAELPKEVRFAKHNHPSYGALLDRNCSHYLDSAIHPNLERIRKLVKKGKYSFLFDSAGHFVSDSMEKCGRLPPL